jgi:hypothetical protein
MTEGLYDRYFLRGAKPGDSPELAKRICGYVDDDVVKGSFFYCGMFMTPKFSTGIHSGHNHPYPEVLLFQGLDPDNPTDLGGELELHMGPEFELHLFEKTTAVYMPPRFAHCPIIFRMRKPSFHVYSMTGPLLVRDDYVQFIKQDTVFERQYGKYFVKGPKAGETREIYRNCTTYLDSDVIPGSLYSFASSFVSNADPLREEVPHSHPYREILGFYGTNPDNKFDLGAEIEFMIGPNLERHTFNQTTVVYLPAGLTHAVTKCKANRPFMFVECADSPKLG